MIKQPYHVLKFSASFCLLEIRVNDIPIIILNLDGQTSVNIPFNNAIFNSGSQKISTKVLPKLGDTILSSATELKYEILLYDVSRGFDYKSTILSYALPKIDKNEPKAIISNENGFKAEVPFTLNTIWKQGKDIQKVNDFKKEIRAAYYSLGKLILNGKYEEFKRKLVQREENIAKSMYLNPLDSRARLNGLITDFKNGFNTMVLAEDAVEVISAEDKKVSLKRPNGNPALCAIKKETGEQLFLDIEFYFNKSTKQFEVI